MVANPTSHPASKPTTNTVRNLVVYDIDSMSEGHTAGSVTEPESELEDGVIMGEKDWDLSPQNQLGLPENQYWNANPQDFLIGGSNVLDKLRESWFVQLLKLLRLIQHR